MMLISEAQALMSQCCPFIPHGLSFLLGTSCARLQMSLLVSKNPAIIQYWNCEFNPMYSDITFSPEILSKVSGLLFTLFSQAPDCVVHPASQQAVLDLALLSGVVSFETPERLQQSFVSLSVASAVRSSRRFIQSLIASSADVPPTTCPALLLNENKGQNLRGIAAAYYAHVCSLDLPIFDTGVLELRTLFFFRCFEEQCKSFKALAKDAESITVETGHIVGQWYKVDARIFKTADAPPESTVATTRTISAGAPAGRKGGRDGILKGSLYFFLGIVVDQDDTKKKSGRGVSSSPESTGRFLPLTVAAQFNDLRRTSDAMSEIGLCLEEAQRFENSDANAQATRDQQDSKSKRKHVKQIKIIEQPPAGAILKGHGQAIFKDAEVRWRVALHQAEIVFNKSNRIISLIADQRNSWPAEIRMNNVEIANANALSHLFNTEYGISESVPQLATWIATNVVTASVNNAKNSLPDDV
jgi:hypothetical protein